MPLQCSQPWTAPSRSQGAALAACHVLCRCRKVAAVVGRILGLIPSLAGIPAALELQSNKSGYGAAAELLPGALHGCTRQPNAGNSVAPQHLSTSLRRLSNLSVLLVGT